MSCVMICMARMAVGYIVYLGAMSVWCCTGVEIRKVYEGDVALPRTGSDEPVDMLKHGGVSTIGPEGPWYETGSVAYCSGDEEGDVMMVMLPCPGPVLTSWSICWGRSYVYYIVVLVQSAPVMRPGRWWMFPVMC